jgi:hypothetical protein
MVVGESLLTTIATNTTTEKFAKIFFGEIEHLIDRGGIECS